MNTRPLLALIGLWFGNLAYSPVAYAVVPTEAEFRQLPQYCQLQKFMADWHGGKTPEQVSSGHRLWESRFGPTYSHMHHWCWGLISMNRYYSQFTNPQRNGFLSEAIGDITYVIKNADKNFVMLPEMLTQRGKAYSLLKDYGKAAADFSRAISANPKYVPAYLYYAETYISVGQPEPAKEIVKRGLAVAPDSKALAKLSQRLSAEKK